MGKALILGKDTKHLDKDIELCRTTNERISDQAAQLLIENQIPFTRSFIKIPFFLREKYRGAHQFYVIHTNRNRYSQARHTIQIPFFLYLTDFIQVTIPLFSHSVHDF